MMKKIIGLLIFNLLLLNCFATHNRAGEITFRQTGTLSFEITITTFTYSLSPADRNELEVQWGDNTSSIAPRVSKIYLPNHYIHNTYITSHIFPGPGIYEVLVQDPNR
ncbi:MAG: gliding motility-associated C-terminal domain-containing protein, partial [Bacteroidota bacterium]|nr:gliding motility-associated C-terminal domain-containing protein [Bacteroidota bacterium]